MDTHTTHTAHLPPTPPSELANDHLSKTDSVMASSLQPPQQHKHIWVITGPAGCGKTSVAEFLHASFGLPYLEGDTFHTPQNVQKMAAGQPLTDADRWDWLILLREQALKTLSTATSSPTGVIVTCSALKRKYRDVMRIATYHDPSIRVHFVFLKASEALLMDRVRARQNHYMKDYMVHSQFESLEAPVLEEERDVVSVDASGTSAEVQMAALEAVKGAMEGDR